MNQVIRHDTVRGQVYRRIRENIEDGQYQPGDRLNEQQIADDLSVSRSPVREAIKQLTGDGFVVYVPNKGSFVKELTRKELDDMYDMRVMIETYAIERACRRLLPEVRAQLQHHYDNFPEAHAKRELSRYIALDKEFHTALVVNSGNQFAIDVFENLYMQISLFRSISLSDAGRYRLSLRDHMDMIRFIFAGDDAQAVHLLRMHLLRGKETVRDNLTG